MRIRRGEYLIPEISFTYKDGWEARQIAGKENGEGIKVAAEQMKSDEEYTWWKMDIIEMLRNMMVQFDHTMEGPLVDQKIKSTESLGNSRFEK